MNEINDDDNQSCIKVYALNKIASRSDQNY